MLFRWLGFVIPQQARHYDAAMPYQSTLRLALIAHDAKKADIVTIATDFKAFLSTCKLCATGTTGARITQATGLKIERFLSGPMGGDLQIGARLASGKIDGVIFLRDPMTPQPHEPDINALVRACDVHNVPCATNVASAQLLLQSLMVVTS
jgi:methylglyoxal synthase